MDLLTEIQTHTARQRFAGAVIAGKYRLDEPLGEGSQGTVWQAYNLDLDLPVAVKLMHPLSEAGLAMAPNRLFREARTAATLGHPAIVRIFDFGQTSDGLPYLAMELLRGVNLARHIQQAGRLSPELAVRLILPIADALAAAHGQGIVHRDVKPDNIMLSISAGSMQPKLLDFGIARVADGQHLTQTGSVIGTPNYLPPEQARGLEEVDERADVWALCATLYECVTGVVPFPAPTWIDVLRRIIDDELEPIAAHGVDDPELWALIQKGLAKSPDDRWSNMQEFACAASQWLLTRGVRCDICGMSVESRWLRPPSAVGLVNGATTNDTGTWWDNEPSPSAQRSRKARRRRILGWSAPLLCIAATIGVTRAGAWVFKSPPNAVGAASEPTPHREGTSAHLDRGSSLPSAQPRVPSPEAELSTVQVATLVEPAKVGASVGETPRHGDIVKHSDIASHNDVADDSVVNSAAVNSAAVNVAADVSKPAPTLGSTSPGKPTKTSLLETNPRKPEVPARSGSPAKPPAPKSLDTLDLMDPY